MTKVRFYDKVDDQKLRFAVIVTKSDGHWVFCKHKERSTLEVPGGHREPGEDILSAAKRELYEETGAVDFSIEPVCVYSVTAPRNFDGQETFGMLFCADVRAFEKELHSEIERIVIQDDLPDAWTYPDIQPYLMQEVQKRQNVRTMDIQEGLPGKMDLQDCYALEDLFPKSFADYEERPYGILFYNRQNKDSYDSNHAVIFREKVKNLSDAVKDIVAFYREKNLVPMIYQSARDSGYFAEIKGSLEKEGFDCWTEEQKFMLLTAENHIKPNDNLLVRKTNSWDPSFEQIFAEAEEPWETEVLKKSLEDPGTVLWVAWLGEKPIGMLYGLANGGICRGNYVLVSKQHRNVGAGRTLTYHYVEWCKASGLQKVFHWPAGEHPEKIYREGGFRVVETVCAGRAVAR